jgi:hypothetical protein
LVLFQLKKKKKNLTLTEISVFAINYYFIPEKYGNKKTKNNNNLKTVGDSSEIQNQTQADNSTMISGQQPNDF